MSAEGLGITIYPARFGRALVIAALYVFFGATIGALWFTVIGVTIAGFEGKLTEEFPGQAALAVAFFWPFVQIGAVIVGGPPAAATGLMLAAEFALRGRVSWLASVLAPLAAVYLFNPDLGGKFTDERFLIGVASSLTIRLLANPLMGGAGLQAAPVRIRIFDKNGALRAAPSAMGHVIKGWRMRTVLALAGVAPLLAAVVCYGFDNGTNAPFPSHSFVDYWALSLVLTTIGSVVLAFVAKPDRGVTLVNAIWTQLPAWSLFFLLAKRDQTAIAGAMTASVAAVVIVTLVFRRWLRQAHAP